MRPLRPEHPFLGPLDPVRPPQIFYEDNTASPAVETHFDSAEANEEEEDVEEALVAKPLRSPQLRPLRSVQHTHPHICPTEVGATNASLGAVTTQLTEQSNVKRIVSMR